MPALSPRHLALALAGGLAALALPGIAAAAPLAVLSYDMPNGGGQASGGSFNYWDAGYTGSGATTTDGAPLSGGLGKLTDGVISATLWSIVSNNAGTGPYVGWRTPFQNPVITFHFAGTPTIASVTIDFDNSFVGGVAAPADVVIDGVHHAIPLQPAGFFELTLPVNTAESELSLGLVAQGQNTFPWVFVSEVRFDSASNDVAVPEPATLALFGAALAGIGLARRRART